MSEEIVQGIVPVRQRDLVLLMEAGYLYLEMQKYEEAKDVFEGAAALVPHSEVPHLAMGHLHFSLGRHQPALKSHQQALKLNAESAVAHASVGEVLLFLRRFDEALDCLDRAIGLDPQGSAGAFARALKEAHELGVFG
jgi:tetratricopeptide (TPR) repeat protein